MESRCRVKISTNETIGGIQYSQVEYNMISARLCGKTVSAKVEFSKCVLRECFARLCYVLRGIEIDETWSLHWKPSVSLSWGDTCQ